MKDDFLNRTQFVDRIVEFICILSDMKKGTTFAIDGKWGSGKTFVLKMLEDKLREYQCENTSDDKFLLVNYNCWQYDYYEEPSIAMVSAILDSIDRAERFSKLDGKIKATWSLFKDDVKTMAGKFAENHIGINVVDVVERIMDEEKIQEKKKTEFDKLFAFKKTLEEARKTLSKIAKEKTIVFIVDELDRCMPTYAIKVMERLHHFFQEIDNIIVILAVDSKQLTHSVKEIYGQGLDEKGYLKKFIELTFQLDTGNVNGDIFEKYSSYFSRFKIENSSERESIEEIFSNIWSGVDIRTQEKAMEKVEAIHNLITNKETEAAVSLYEIMSVRFKDLRESDLSWISELNHAAYLGVEKKLKKDTFEFLLRLKERAETGSYYQTFNSGPRYYTLRCDIIGLCFYYLYENYPGSTKFQLEFTTFISKETVKITQEFAELLSVID